MSQLTNNHDLPQSIVDAVMNDPYTGGGDISATKLIDAPQVRRLSTLHHDKIVVDVSDRVWTLLGQAMHTILERAGIRAEGMIAEQRLFHTVEGPYGPWTLSGQFDVMDLDRKALIDYKVTTVYKWKGSDSWTRQLNVLRWLAHKNGEEVNELEIIALFRDWRKTDLERRLEYPPAAIQRIPVPVWPLEKAEAYVMERVAMHQAAQAGVAVHCTPEERWRGSDTFAIVKPNAGRAFKVLEQEPTPEQVPEGYHVERRPGENTRCLKYCDVAPFCAQWARIQAEGENEADMEGDLNPDVFYA